MNPNDNKNRKNGKGGGSWRGVVSLVGWALVLTIVVSYASSVLGSTGRQASSVNIEYSQFVEMVEDGQVEGVKFDDSEPILLITPAEGFAYTAENGTVYTRTKDGYTYEDAMGQEQTAHLELFTVQIQSNDAVIDLLTSNGVEIFDQDYQPPVNPVLALLVSYVLPFVLIFLFMTLVYRLPGFIASIALLGQVAATLAAVSGYFGVFNSFTLTLPGIAGIILAIGMGVDANVITAERIKEELRAGKTLDGALNAGFRPFRLKFTVLSSIRMSVMSGSRRILIFG